MSETILRTKLFMPPLRPLLVERPRLLSQLNQGVQSKLILVAAPAGFGKTTIVSHWLAQQNQPAAWLSLDENDNETARFFTYLITAVHTIYPELAQTLFTGLQSANPPEDEAIMPALVNELSAQVSPLWLVLDDYHLIENSFLHEALAFLIDAMPPHIHLVITSREDPPLPLPRWRVRGQLTELRDLDLRFTSAEASEFLAKTMGLSLPETAVATLEKRTEGWVAGLQLAALSLRNLDDASEFIDQFTGSDRQIADYLMQEVLFQQPEAVQTFLLRTSILERFNARLCDALLAQQHSQDILDVLEQGNLFLIPLDNHRYWYRYHHLFTQLLRFRLAREQEAATVAALHRRAAQWYQSENLIEEAVSHALQIPDYDFAAELITTLPVSYMYEKGGSSLIKQWATALPEEVLRRYPQVTVLLIGTYLTTGDVARVHHYLEIIAGETAVYPEYCLFRSIFVRNEDSDYEQALHLAETAYAGLKDRETTIAALALMQVAVNHFNLGHLKLAEQKITDMRRMLTAAPAENVNIHLQAIYMQAGATYNRLNVFQAEQICLEGLELADQQTQAYAPMVGWIFALLANVYYEWNELQKATDYADKAMVWAERTGISDIFIQANMIQAELACTAADVKKVETITQTLKSYAKGSHMEDVILVTDCYCAFFFLKVGQLDTAVRWANASGLSLADDFSFAKFSRYWILARIRLAESQATGEKQVTTSILACAEKLEQLGRETEHEMALLEALTLKALVLDWRGDEKKASATLSACLDMAMAGSMMRLFLDFGEPMRQLLKRTRTQQPAYAARLLQAFEAAATTGSGLLQSEPTAVSLTEREMDVLQAIAAGLSNKEIEESLFISKNTVRTHIKNLYSKLGVESRTQAILKAQELHILHP